MNKDQVNALALLRESANENKATLEAETERSRKQNEDLAEKNCMQLEHVNVLLLNKVNLRTEEIGQCSSVSMISGM